MSVPEIIELAEVETIRDGDKTIAIILHGSLRRDGVTFLTPPEYSQQLAFMRHPKGYRIKAHTHKKAPRAVDYTLEVLFIRSGKLRVDLYRDDKSYLQSIVLGADDTVLLVSGGHGLEFLEAAEVIEVKQGPYMGINLDKEQFDPLEAVEPG